MQRGTTCSLCVSALLASSCHSFVPDLRTAADRAHELSTKCASSTVEQAARFVSPAAVEAVEPSYSYVKSGPEDRQARLRGARLHLRPGPGMTRELVTRELECHEARATLGQEVAPADDPYVLPGSWVEIEVDSEGDGFVVDARVDEFEPARQVLDRARRFAGRR